MINSPPRVCIVGLGPAGIGAALTLSKLGKSIDLICIDAGNTPKKRLCNELINQECDKEDFCQITCGFGGCALVTGGKLSNFPAGKGLVSVYGSEEKAKESLMQAFKLISQYLPSEKPTSSPVEIEREKQLFVELGFDYRYYDAYLCEQKKVVNAFELIYKELEFNGASVLMQTELIGAKRNGRGFDLIVKHLEKTRTVFVDYLILAIGRSGRQMLKEIGSSMGLKGKQNSLDIGVRLEFPTQLFTEKVKVHNDLKLLFGNARTFCVCKDGGIVHYYTQGIRLTEGCSTGLQRTGVTNIGIIVRLPPSEENDNIYHQIREKIAQVYSGKIVVESLSNYITQDNKTKEELKNISNEDYFQVHGNINEIFPESVSASVKEAVVFFVSRFFSKRNWDKITVYAPEIDYGGTVFPISNDFSTSHNMYIIGDCSGRFRGILQSLGTGISCAEKIIGDLNEKYS